MMGTLMMKCILPDHAAKTMQKKRKWDIEQIVAGVSTYAFWAMNLCFYTENA